MGEPILRLVKNQPIFDTLQGEGIRLGVPSTFVRLWGCDFACSWCDTKHSWAPGSEFITKSIVSVFGDINRRKCLDVVVTGGNPVLQGDVLAEMLVGVSYRKHVTIETQGSIYHPVLDRCDLLSLSPKLDNWKEETLLECIYGSSKRRNESRSVQFKLVIEDDAQVLEAIRRIDHLHSVCLAAGYQSRNVHFFLQPEWSKGRMLVRAIHERLINYYAGINGSPLYVVRVVPQMHKFVGMP